MLLKHKALTWTKLSLISRISFLKMKLLPVILYFLRHAPTWVPKSYFRKLDGIVSSFLWAPKPPRIGIKVLQEPGDRGGLALPDWQKYLAGQMVFVHQWLQADDGDWATVLEAAHLGSLRLAIYRGFKSNLPLTMKATIRAWETATKLACPSHTGITPSTHLWMNPAQSHFYHILDPML